MSRRDYLAIAAAVSPVGTRRDRMQSAADAIWDATADLGVSWVGFYLDDPEAPDDRRLVLGPHRDGPACSPIGMHGVCGGALVNGRTQIIADVVDRGDAYIACDPRDRAEIAVPMIDAGGVAWGVLDLDSHQVGAFDHDDARGLEIVLAAAGLIDAAGGVTPPA